MSGKNPLGSGREPQSYEGLNVIVPLGGFQVIRSKGATARNPTSNDKKYPVCSMWVNSSNNTVWVLTSVAGNSATWTEVDNAGGSGVFTALTVTGTSSLIGTTGINTSGSSVTTIGTGGTGATNIGNATGNTAITGSVTSSAGITASSGDIVATLGNITSSAGSVNAGTTMTATLGNITATNGDFVASTAAKGVVLGGGAKLVCGTGDPNATVTAPKGSLYLRLDGSSSSTRAYINTNGTTAWTAVTTAG